MLYELDHRADELIGLKVDVSGEFTTDFELVCVREEQKKVTLRLQNPPRRNTLPWHSRTRVSQRLTTADFAPRPSHAKRPPSRAAIPPASTSCVFFFAGDFTCAASFAEQRAPAPLDENRHGGPRVPVINPADRVIKKDPVNSRASGAGQLACFGRPLRERPCLGGKCQQARGCSWAFATMLGSA